MSKEPLNQNVSVGAELTETGLNVNAKSRLVTAIDRFCGNLFEFGNIPMERRHAKGRAEIELDQTKRDGERQLVEAMTRAAIKRIKTDPAFAERAIENYLGKMAVQQENKDQVVRNAVEDLRRDPTANEAGELDPAFLDRFERHAEEASIEALREKWGRVLAAEIRDPGSITPRVMRIVDEIEASTAELFEEFCLSRLANFVPVCLHGRLKAPDVAALVGADLLVEPGVGGQVCYSAKISDDQGKEVSFLTFGRNGVGWRTELPAATLRKGDGPLQAHDNGPAVPVYVLTNAGFAVSKILPKTESDAFGRYVAALRAFAPDVTFEQYVAVGDDRWGVVANA